MLNSLNARETYCLSVSARPSELCDELYDYTMKNSARAQMLIGPLVGTYLGFLIESLRVKTILEIGCFTGYSALCMAERLPAEGRLTSLDINAETVAIAESFWRRSPHGSKISALVGPALESLKTLKGPFDLVLIDADKENYAHYADWALNHLSSRGVMILDNCLWSDRVLDPRCDDPETIALRRVSQSLSARRDLSTVLLPIRDGLLCVTKKDLI